MSANVRPEVSEKNEYYLERHRYYELRHFCLQYPLWKNEYAELDGMDRKDAVVSVTDKNMNSDRIAGTAERRVYLSERIDMVNKAAALTDPVLGRFVLTAVTTDRSYDYLKTMLDIPCGKEVYYKMYRKFFVILDRLRN